MKTKVKVKKNEKADQVLYLTVKDFQRTMGLGTETASYIAATVMLKMLVSRGIAKEVDRINTSSLGRKSVVYRIPVQFTLKTKAKGEAA